MDLTQMIKLSKGRTVRIRYRNIEECKLLLDDIERQTDLCWFEGQRPTEYIPKKIVKGHIAIYATDICCDSFTEEDYSKLDNVFWYKNDMIIPSSQDLMEFLKV